MSREPAAVYHLHNSAGELLYIGMSINPERRWEQHSKKRAWWAEVDPGRTVVRWYADRFAAAVVEQQDERAGSPKYGKDQPAFGRLFLARLARDGYDVMPIPDPRAVGE